MYHKDVQAVPHASRVGDGPPQQKPRQRAVVERFRLQGLGQLQHVIRQRVVGREVVEFLHGVGTNEGIVAPHQFQRVADAWGVPTTQQHVPGWWWWWRDGGVEGGVV
jgi:hypothetical protein